MEYFVYVLKLENNPIYVGVTSNLEKRKMAHKYSGKTFDSIVIIETFSNKVDALTAERAIIKFLSVFENHNITNGLYVNRKYETLYKR